MTLWECFGLSKFLYDKRGLRLKELSSERLILEGAYLIDAPMKGFEHITELVNLRVEFNKRYPKAIPKVIELDEKIPRQPDFHINGDDSCCLGSDLRILQIISNDSQIENFFTKCVEPFLYSIFYKMKYGILPYGELPHYEAGLVQDYEELFNIKGRDNVFLLLKALGKRKRVANKLFCPCGCGRLLGRCDFRNKLIEWRRIAKRRWYLKHLNDNFKPIQNLTNQKSQCRLF